MHARGRRDGKDEFEVGCPRDKAHKKTVKNLMKSKKKKKRKGKKEKKKRKGKPYETESDEEYEDIVDAGEEKQRRELNIYIDGAQGDDDDDDYEYTNDVKRKTRFEETDDEKLRRRRRLKKVSICSYSDTCSVSSLNASFYMFFSFSFLSTCNYFSSTTFN